MKTQLYTFSLVAHVLLMACSSGDGSGNDSGSSQGGDSSSGGGATAGANDGGPAGDGGTTTGAGGAASGQDGGGASGGASAGGTTSTGGAGATEDPCAAYKNEFCDFVVSCGLVLNKSRAQCLADFDLGACLSDEIATDCRATLQGAACAPPPQDCFIAQVLDPTEARTVCETFSDMVCTLDVSCGGPGYDACRADFYQVFPCDLMITLSRDPASCLAEVQAADCATEPAGACDGLFVF